MTIHFNPPRLKEIINSPLADKRLKNRDAKIMCSCGEFSREDRILSLLPEIHKHNEQFPDHRIEVIEATCGMGLL